MRKLVLLLALAAVGAYSASASAETYAFGFSSFTSSNDIASNSGAFNNVDSGWINSNGLHQGGNTNYYSGCCDTGGTFDVRNYFSFDLTGATGPVTSASFDVDTYTITVAGTYEIFGTSLTPTQVNSANGFTNLGYYDALGVNPIGSISLTPGESNSTVDITFDAAGIAWLNANLGSDVVLGGELLVTPPPATTPEPSSIALFGTGILGLAGITRRRFLTR